MYIIDSPFSLYIGLKKAKTSDYFQWIDGTMLQDTWSDWYSDEPNDDSQQETCVIVGWFHDTSRGHKWTDVDCNERSRSRYICQRSIGMG